MKNLIDSLTLSLFRTSAIEILGWTLLHFLWQGTLIALILAVLVWLLRNRHPSLRYLLACASLAVMLACPIVTYFVLDSSNATPPVVETALPPQTEPVAEPALVNDVQVQPAIAPVVFAPEGGTGKKTSWLERNLKPWLPYMVVFWGIGVLVLSIRLLGGLWVLRKLRTRLTKPVSTMLMSQLNSVAERLGLARAVQLRESLVVTVPLVVGWLNPMILLPSSVMSGLSVKQLEMILAHELAHIRRHDYLVNLLQSVVETLLFYHPAVWWVSGKIRHERELCCDDLAIKVCGGDKQSYAQALADLDDLRPNVQFVQAATGGSLVNRVLRLVDQAITKSFDPRQWMVGLSVITLSLVMFTVIGLNLTIAQDDKITLRLAVSDGLGRPGEAYINEFIEQVKTLSAGKMTIEPTWDAGRDTEAGFETGVIQHVTKGDFDLGIVASRAWDNEGVMSFQALQAPFLIDNDALAEAVATSDIATKMLESLSSARVVGLTLWPEELRHPIAFEPYSKPFLLLEDFAGTTIRTIPSSVTWEMFKVLGATAIFKEQYGQDVIDGRIQGVEAGMLSGQGTTMSFPGTATGNVTFYPKFQVLFVNSAALERLSNEQRNILQEAATEAKNKAIAERPKEVDAATNFCTNGGTVVLASEEQIAEFEKATQPVFDQIEQDPTNAEYIAAIRELKVNTSASPGAAACGPTPPNAMYRGKLPPDGVYHHTNTEEELLAKGARPDFARGTAGTMTWSITNGQLDSQGACSWTFNSTGDVLEVSLPIGPCTDIAVTNDFLWRQLKDGSLEFYFLSSTDPGPQLQVENRALFEGVWQKTE